MCTVKCDKMLSAGMATTWTFSAGSNSAVGRQGINSWVPSLSYITKASV